MPVLFQKKKALHVISFILKTTLWNVYYACFMNEDTKAQRSYASKSLYH